MTYFGTCASRNRHRYPDNKQEAVASGLVRSVWCRDLQKKLNDVWLRRIEGELMDGD